eukprot:CAMPEP_0119479858 /NCGR_PEP_ID=MMETSP1344-20130328/8934_1 /TAXON_ID=236787 /ORGANISM="Florenciella parvula, Strain CCMP2471" /LENGTH=200 /DNA_ID=CAMNT_0007514125 /DNA_START=78 /DNA_END=680 /DNA_ORIENTATION=+
MTKESSSNSLEDMEWEEEDGFQRGEGRTAVAHSDELSPRSLRVVYVGLACMAAAVVATGAVVMTSSTPSTPVKESVPSLYEESQSFLRMARSTEGYSVEMSDDDCSEIETALDDCFDDSKNVTTEVSCLDIKELILDEVCDDSYTVSDDVVDYMYDYYEEYGICNTTSAVIDDCWESSTICDIYKEYIYDIVDDDYDCDL